MIDAAIPMQSQAPQVPAIMGQLVSLKNAGIQQQQAQQNLATGAIRQQGDQLALNQAGQSAQDEADVRAAMAAGTQTDPTTGQVSLNRGAMLNTLGKLNPTKAAQISSTLASQDTASQEAAAKLQKAQMDAATAHVDAKDKLLQGVSDQATYTNALQQGYQLGIIKPGDLPTTYDPQLVAQLHAQTMSQKETLAQKNKEAEDAEKAKNDVAERAQAAATLANTQSYQRAELKIRAGELGVQQGGLNLKRQEDATDTNGTGTTPAPTVADRNRASLAKIARDNIDGIQQIVQKRGDLFGPGAGRVSNVDQIVGSNDPDLVAVTNLAHNFSMANAGVHGSRSVQNVRDAVQDLLGDMHNGAAGIMGGLKVNRSNLNSIIDSGSAPVKMKAPNGQVTTVPASQVDHYKALGAQVAQ